MQKRRKAKNADRKEMQEKKKGKKCCQEGIAEKEIKANCRKAENQKCRQKRISGKIEREE